MTPAPSKSSAPAPNRASGSHAPLPPWSGNDVTDMLTAGARILEAHMEIVNRLNVFPVPDGDTGTNMALTLRDTLAGARSADDDTAAAAGKAMWHAARYGSRGNSGTVVSQLFRGMAEAFDGKNAAAAADMATALRLARDYAYAAIANPVEGTMLTVFTHAANAAENAVADSPDAAATLAAAADAAKRAVELTPTLMPRLREAGVVDSGGLGLWMLFEGMRRCAAGDETPANDLDMPMYGGVSAAEASISSAFFDLTDDEEYGNCTQFVIESAPDNGPLDMDAIRAALETMAQSTVVIGDETLVKAHVHTETPDALLDYARTLGKVSNVSVQNMDEQRREMEAARRQSGQPAQPAPRGHPAELAEVGALAVAWGSGLEAVFREHGASVMVAGDTMNPSVREIVDAIESVPAKAVFVLPNNGNILSSARQAAELADRQVHVLPTTAIPQGIAAILEFLPHGGPDDNSDRMESAIDGVRTGEITRADRSVTLDGVAVEEGQLIGLFERRLIIAGAGITDALKAVLRAAGADNHDAEIATLYRGEPLTQPEGEDAANDARAAFPSLEIEHVYGGQPHYHFIISVE